jgi:hypothetical protein
MSINSRSFSLRRSQQAKQISSSSSITPRTQETVSTASNSRTAARRSGSRATSNDEQSVSRTSSPSGTQVLRTYANPDSKKPVKKNGRSKKMSQAFGASQVRTSSGLTIGNEVSDQTISVKKPIYRKKKI